MRPQTSGSSRRLELLKTAVFKTPTRFFCENCEKYVPSTMPWLCAACGAMHTDVRLYSFLHKCKECKRKPDAVECPYCKTVWAFSRRGVVKNVARKIPALLSMVAPTETEAEKRKREHTERKEELERAREIAELTKKLKDLEGQSTPKHGKKFQQTQDEIMDEFETFFATDITTSRLERILDEQLKDYPELREKVKDWIASIRRNRA